MPLVPALALVLLAAVARPETATPHHELSADPDRVAAPVDDELRALHASTAADLVAGAPRPAVHASGSFTLEHGDGRAVIVVLGLAPGAPGNLPVDTQIESLRYTVMTSAGGTPRVVVRPAREDLVTGVGQALQGEARAMEAAAATLLGAHVALPAGRATWKEALRSVVYDARLPRGQFVGDPSWSFIFEPWDEAHGGWHQVLLSSGFGVEMVDGRAP